MLLSVKRPSFGIRPPGAPTSIRPPRSAHGVSGSSLFRRPGRAMPQADWAAPQPDWVAPQPDWAAPQADWAAPQADWAAPTGDSHPAEPEPASKPPRRPRSGSSPRNRHRLAGPRRSPLGNPGTVRAAPEESLETSTGAPRSSPPRSSSSSSASSWSALLTTAARGAQPGVRGRQGPPPHRGPRPPPAPRRPPPRRRTPRTTRGRRRGASTSSPATMPASAPMSAATTSWSTTRLPGRGNSCAVTASPTAGPGSCGRSPPRNGPWP